MSFNPLIPLLRHYIKFTYCKLALQTVMYLTTSDVFPQIVEKEYSL